MNLQISIASLDDIPSSRYFTIQSSTLFGIFLERTEQETTNVRERKKARRTHTDRPAIDAVLLAQVRRGVGGVLMLTPEITLQLLA